MIFATDLDRTLIYSERFLEKFDKEAVNVELFNEKPITYMTQKALQLLEKLNESAAIIPVTTRNYEQYHRIKIFSEVIRPEIYIINNGGTIFIKGEEDRGWTEKIQQQLAHLSFSYDEVLQLFLEKYEGPVERYKKSDQLIWLILGDEEQMDYDAIGKFKEFLKESGWSIDVSGRKIYLYPSCVNKWSAVHYIKENYLNRKIIAAGDSEFDYEMVHKADIGIVPKGAWIQEKSHAAVYITEKEGMEAAEDILSLVLESCRKNKETR